MLRKQVKCVLENLGNLFKKKAYVTTGEKIFIPKNSKIGILDKLVKGGTISLTDVNLYLSDEHNLPSLTTDNFKLHPSLLEDAVFVFDSFVVEEKSGSRVLFINLKESVYGLPLKVTMDITRLSEVFKPLVMNEIEESEK